MKVEELSEKEKQPTLVDGMPIFEQRLGNIIYDEKGEMGEIIKNVEHVHPIFREK